MRKFSAKHSQQNIRKGKGLPSLLVLLLVFLFFSEKSFADNGTVNAGINRTVCANETLTLYGQKNGLFSIQPKWTQISGPSVVINTPNALQTTVTGATGDNVYVFRLYATCQDGALVYQNVTITVTPFINANAGIDRILCPGAYTLEGNDPGSNPGQWTIIGSNNAGVSFPGGNTNYNSSINLSPGSSGSTTLRWKITHSVSLCEDYDDVVITNYGGVSPVEAGPTINVNNCYSATTSATLNGSYAGSYGTWTVVSGPNIPDITDTHVNNTGVSSLIEGTYVFKWTVAGPCVNGSDDVSVIVPPPAGSVSVASVTPANPQYCDSRTSIVVTGSQPNFASETVSWVQTTGHGGVTIGSPTSPSTTISGLNPANTYTFRYTITNTSTGCSSSATTTISYGIAPTLTVTSTSPIFLTCGLSSADINFTSTGAGGVSWSIISAPSGFGVVPTGYAPDNSSPATVTGLNIEGTYIVRLKKESNGNGCDAVFKDLTIIVSKGAAVANAGTDILVACNVYTTGLAGNEPSDGGGKGIGSWSLVAKPSGAPDPAISDIYNKNALLTGLVNGTYTFRWTINAGSECDVTQDDVNVVVSNLTPSHADAGPDQTVCYNIPVSLNGDAPLINERGVWSVIPSSGVIFSDIYDRNAIVTGLVASTAYTFTWTIENACGNHSDNCIITTSSTQGPTVPNAGPDQCLAPGTTTVTLQGNSPTSGSGTWTKISGTGGSITTSSLYNSTVTGLTNGTYEFQWSISNDCLTLTDNVIITIGTVSTANAGVDQYICADNQVTLAAVSPVTGTGVWTQLLGPGGATFSSATANNPTVTNLVDGIYQFQWTVTNGGCTSSDIIKIYVSIAGITDPDASTLGDRQICNASTVTMDANTITSGHGLWSIVSGPNTPTITSVSSPTTTITGLAPGTYLFRWTAYGAAFCPPKSNDVTINVVQAANAGADQSYCDVNSVNLTGNDGTTGTWSWTVKPTGAPDPTITPNPSGSNAAIASGLVSGTYTFQYTLAAVGSCSSTSDLVDVSIFSTVTSASITTANSEFCDYASFSLVAASPGSNTGTWSVLYGPGGGTFSPNANAASVTFNGAVPGTYVFRWTVSNGQCSSIDEVTIKNYAPPAPNPIDAGPDQSICGTQVTMAADNPTAGLGHWSLLSKSATAPAPTIISEILYNTTITGLAPQSDGSAATYVFTWTVSNGTCDPVSDNVTITVKEVPTAANAGADQNNHCAETVSFTLDGNVPVVGTGLWSLVSKSPGTLPNPTITTPTLPNTTITNIGEGTYVFKWTITASHSTCTSEDEVTINNYALVDATGDAGPDQNICEYDGLTLNAADPAPGSGLWSYVSGPSTPTILSPASRTTAVVGTTTGTYVFRWTITNGSCTSFDDVTVIITAQPPMADAGSDLSLCNATSAVLDGNDPAPSTGKWTIPSSPGGSAPSFGNDTQYNTTISNLTVAGSYTLRWTIGSGSCANYDEMVITVHPTLTTTDPSDANICTGGTNTLSVTASGGDPGTGKSYLWQKSTVSAAGPWTNVSGSTFASYTTPALTTDTWYRCRITNCAEIYSNPAKITVLADPSISIQPTGDTFCSGGSHDMSITASGDPLAGALSYQWQVSSSNSPYNWSNVGGNSSTYTTGSLTATRYYQCIVTQPLSGCSITSDIVTVTVVADPSISTPPANATICNGGTQTLSVTAAGGTPSLTYLWQYWDGGAWQTATGTATNPTYTTPALVATTKYRVIVSATGEDCASTTSSEATVTVVADPTIDTQPSNPANICRGGTTTSISGLTASGGTPSLTYQWQYNNGGSWGNVVNGTPSGAVYSNPTSSTTFTVGGTNLIAGSFEYRCVVSASGNGCGSATSNSAFVTVVDDPTVNTQPVGATICNNSTHNMTVSATGGTGAFTYQWQESDDNGVGDAWANAVGGSGATTTSYTTQSLTQKIWYRVQISQSGAGCNTIYSNSVAVYVPKISTQPTGSIVCVGATYAMTVAANSGGGTETYTYQWQFSADGASGWTNVADGTGATTTSYSTAPLTVGHFYYRCLITAVVGSACGTVLTSTTAHVEAKADPNVSVQPTGSSICTGGTHSMSIVVSNGTGVTSYQWEESNDNGVTDSWANAVSGSGATSASYTSPSLTSTIWYRCKVTQTGLDCNQTFSNSVQVTVLPDPTVSDPIGTTICNGATYTFPAITVSNGVSPTIQWEESDDNGVGDTWANVVGGSNETTTSYTTASLTTNRWYRVRINDPGSGCSNPVYSNGVKVSIPTITTQPASNLASCLGVAYAMNIVVDGGSASLSYQWQFSDFDCNSGWNNIVGATTASYNALPANLPPLGGTRYFRCVVTTGAPTCSIYSSCATVTVVGCNPKIGVAKQLVSMDSNGDGTYEALFNIRVQNYGGVQLDNIQVTENLVNGTGTSFGAGNYSVLGRSSTSFDVNTSFDGNSDVNLLNNAGTHNILAVGASTDIRLRVKILSAGSYSNTVTATSTTGSVTDVSQNGSDPDPDGDGNPGNNSVPTPIVTACNPVMTVSASDGVMCHPNVTFNQTFQTVASASNASSYLWTTDGTGTFSSTTSLTPTYTPSASDVQDGQVRLKVTAYSGGVCPNVEATMVLTIWKTPVAATASTTIQPTCSVATGTIVVTAPLGLYEYNIDGGTYQASTTFTGVAAGSRTILVRNINYTSCISSATSVTVNAQPTAPAAATTTITQPSCSTTTGTIVVTAPTGAYEYNIDGGAYQSSATFAGVAVGTHTILVRRSTDNTCVSSTASVTINAQLSTPVAATASTTIQPTCSVVTGTIVVTNPVGAVYEYNIDGGTYQASPTFTGIAAGSHNILVRRAVDHACISTATNVTVNAQPTAPAEATASTTIQPTCSVATGTIVVTAPLGQYEYNIDGGTYQASTTFTGVVAGSHTILVRRTNDNTCISSATSVSVNAQPTAPVLSATQVNLTCNGANTGSINLSVAGGTSPYSYAWSNGFNAEDPTGLTAGTYTVVVTDKNGCTQTASYTLTQPAAVTLTANVTANTNCNASAGSVTLTGSEAGSVTLNGVTKPSPASFTLLAAGYYTATFTATAASCSATATFNIKNINSTLAATVSVPDPLCFGGTVTATVTATGGTGAGTYTYVLNGTTTNTTGVFTNLATSKNNVLVTDNNGCTYYLAFDIDEPTLLVAHISGYTNVTCKSSANGTATVDVTGGTTSYTYSWNTSPPQTTAMATGLAPGNYTVTLTDAHSCTTTASVTITESVCNPNAVDDNITTPEDTPVSGNVLTNDTDPNGLTLSVTIFSIGGTTYAAGTTATITGVGTLIVNSNGTYTFTPVANFNGAIPVVSYIASNGTNTANSEINILISPVDDVPVAVADTYSVNEDNILTGNLGSNDTRSGDGGNVWSVVANPAHGTVVINIDGTFTYTPAVYYIGSDSFTYKLCDTDGSCSTATVTFTINPVNHAPVVADVPKTGAEDSDITFISSDFTSKFTDIDGNSMTQIKIVSLPANGTLKLSEVPVIAGDVITTADISNLTFTPNSNWNGSTSFDWNGFDGTVYAVDAKKVNLTVTPVNDPPIAGTGSMSSQVNPGGTNTVSVLANKFSGTDIDGTIASVKIMTMPTNVTSITVDGITYNTIPLGGLNITTNATGQPLFNISIDPVDGAVTSVLSYFVIDNEGLSSLAAESVTIPFTGLSVTGTVYNDLNGLLDNIVNGIGTNAGGTIFMNLVNTLNQVVASKAVAADGTYGFSEADGLILHTFYKLILTKESKTAGSTLSAATYPAGVISTGENIGSNAGNDGNINGILAVDTYSGSLSNANFGISGAISVSAGVDAVICSSDGAYTLSGISANAGSVLWTTNGTGVFSNPALGNAVYTPSAADIATGEVQLTLTAIGSDNVSSVNDMMVLTIWPSAKAYAGVNQSICRGDVYQVLDASVSNAESMLWTANAGAAGTLSGATTLTPVYTPDAGETGIITLTLTVTPNGGGICTNVSTSKTLTITNAPTVVLGPDINNCALNVTTLTGVATNYSSLEWSTSGTGSFSNTNTLTTTYTPSVTDISNAQVTLRLTARGNGSCTSASDDLVLKLWSNTYAYAGNDVTVCDSQPYQVLDAEATNYLSLSWTHNGTGTLTNATTLSPTYTPGPGETGRVTLTLTAIPEGNGTCPSFSDQKVITIGGIPVVSCPVGSPFIVSNTTGKCGFVVPDTAYDATATGCNGVVTLTHNFNAWSNPNSLAGATFPVGITNVIWTAKDAYGNTSSCTITVHVLDNEPPSFVNCSSNTVFTIGLSPDACETGAIWSRPVATDNCTSVVSLVQTKGPAQGSKLSVGSYLIEYTATDAAGNSSVCSFTVKVIDTERPVVVCRPDFEVQTDKGMCSWTSPVNSLTPLLARGNCASTITWEVTNPDGSKSSGLNDASGYTFQKGISTVKYRNTENVSLQTWDCSFNVSVVDKEPPVITSQGSIVQTANSGVCNALINLIAPSFTDNCGGVPLKTTYTVINPDNSETGTLITTAYTFKAGVSRVVWTLTDQAGNISTCTQLVTVNADPSAMNPYAGPDASICEGSTFTLSSASVAYANEILWLSDGTGFFNNATTLHPVYTPSATDIVKGSVTFTLKATSAAPCTAVNSDEMVLHISRQAIADAGTDATIYDNSTYTIGTASAHYAGAVSWTHNGSGTLSGSNTLTPTYTPVIGKTVVVTLTMTATSAGPCVIATDQMTLTVKHWNRKPNAVPDNFEAKENQKLAGNLLVNDSDIDGDLITLDTIPIQAPLHGKLVLLPNGDFTYHPVIDFMGSDSFIYRICDNGDPVLCDSTTVSITISKDENCDVMVPNSFSPNGDGIHDNFKIRCLYNYENPIIEIYNRWGNLVFKKDHYGDADFWGSEADAWWNGHSTNKLTISNNEELPVGTYYYILKLNKSKVLTGFLFLNR